MGRRVDQPVARASRVHALVINPVIYAEISLSF